jgi:hypothetical protein
MIESSQSNEMKRLEDIPRKNIYQVPEGYFDQLPQVVQSRVVQAKDANIFSFQWNLAWRYAVPVLILASIGVFWLQSSRTVEDQLQGIDVDQLAYFLEDADLAAEELTETVTWSADDIDALEESVYSTLETSGSELDDLIEEFDLNMENL